MISVEQLSNFIYLREKGDTMSAKILIIEDDQVILRFLGLALETNGYEVLDARNGLLGINLYLSHNPDLVLLDLGLPDIDGTEVLEELKKIADKPIIIISARDRDVDKIEALDNGANDYITKPFNVGEVLARVRVALRGAIKINENQIFVYRDLSIDFDRHKVVLNGSEVHLTPIEYKILEVFIKYQGKVLTHKFLQKEVWGYETVDNYQTLRVFIASIRKKLEPENGLNQFIITEVGVGYRFNDE
jgi:two-component system KDP operon response regulator KdpE